MMIPEDKITQNIINKVTNTEIYSTSVDQIRYIPVNECPDDTAFVWVSPKTHAAILKKLKPEEMK